MNKSSNHEIIEVEFSKEQYRSVPVDPPHWLSSSLLRQALSHSTKLHLKPIADRAKAALVENGYAHLRFKRGRGDLGSRALMVTGFLCEICRPIRVFDKIPGIWRPLKSNPSRPPEKSEGIGAQGLHMDFVNCLSPPDLVILFCDQPDPNGGGQTLVADYSEIIDQIPSEYLLELEKKQFSDGEAVGLSNVGHDINPFAVINNDQYWPFRFTENLVKSGRPEIAAAARKVSALVKEATRVIELRKDDMILIDQRRFLHGRTALGPRQQLLREEQRRSLYHSFARQKTS